MSKPATTRSTRVHAPARAAGTRAQPGRVVMTRPAVLPSPAGYRLRVDGHLDEHWSAWFGDLTLTHDSDGTTSISGLVPDQAALFGLLMKVRDLGVTLLSVQVIDPAEQGASDLMI